jgi:hypothetical protein
LHLIPIALTGFRTCDLQLRQFLTSDTVQSIQYSLPLDLAFRLIADMVEITAAALLGIGTCPVDSGLGTSYNRDDLTVSGMLADMLDAKLVFFIRCGIGDKNSTALYSAHSQALAGKAAYSSPI